jgi:hypothetical protein
VAALDILTGDALDEQQVRARARVLRCGGSEGSYHARGRWSGGGGDEPQEGLLDEALTSGEGGDMAQSGA